VTGAGAGVFVALQAGDGSQRALGEAEDLAHRVVSDGAVQAGAAACRAGALLQEPLHPLHALFIFYLRQRIFDCINSVEVGKIKLGKIVGIAFLRMVENMLFLCRSVINDILLPLRQLAKRHIYAHAHLLADISHQRPHEAVPRCNSALLYGKRFIRHQRV